MIQPLEAVGRAIAPLGIPLAWRQLTDEMKRLAAAIIGITFGMMLMLFQLGLYNGIMEMVVLPHLILRGELVMTSPNYEYFGSSFEFSRRRLYQARGVPGVAFTAPLYLGFLNWANSVNGRMRMIFSMAIKPDENPYTIPSIAIQIDMIRDPGSQLYDLLSQDDYGPVPGLFRERGTLYTGGRSGRADGQLRQRT